MHTSLSCLTSHRVPLMSAIILKLPTCTGNEKQVSRYWRHHQTLQHTSECHHVIYWGNYCPQTLTHFPFHCHKFSMYHDICCCFVSLDIYTLAVFLKPVSQNTLLLYKKIRNKSVHTFALLTKKNKFSNFLCWVSCVLFFDWADSSCVCVFSYLLHTALLMIDTSYVNENLGLNKEILACQFVRIELYVHDFTSSSCMSGM